jgi:hypothetical protein
MLQEMGEGFNVVVMGNHLNPHASGLFRFQCLQASLEWALRIAWYK